MGEEASALPGGDPARGAPPLALLGLALAVAACYATAFLGDFQFDDLNVIVREPRVASLPAWWASLPGIRPALKLSFALNQASGLGLLGFHLANVGIHIVNALLAYGVLSRLGPRVPGAALLGALLFALHPVQTEAVTYVSGRSSSLSATFALSSVLLWLEGRVRGKPVLSRALSPALFLGSLLVKESAIVLPFGLLLVLASFGPRPFRWRDALRATSLHFAVLAAAAAALLLAPPYRRMLELAFALRTPSANLLTHAQAVLWLAGQVVRIDLLNADPALPAAGALTAVSAARAALVLLAAAAGLAFVRSGWGFALLWFLLWLPPSGWLVPRPEPANDRQLYLALLGPAWLAGRLLAVSRARRVAALALALLLGTATAARNLVYRDPVRFWEDVVRKSPGNARAYNNLGFSLAAACRIPEADRALVRALEIDPDFVRAAVNLRLLREGEPLEPPSPRQRRCKAPAPDR